MAAAKCPQEVMELVDYLRSTGTGESKLVALMAVGEGCDTGAVFVERASKVVPPGTMEKLMKFAEDKGWVKKPKSKELVKEELPTFAENKELKEQEEEEAENKSEVGGMNADEAIDAISRMRSLEKLEHIVLNDKRSTVQAAASKRIDELEIKPK